MNALVAESGSYIVQLSVCDLHGPTDVMMMLKFETEILIWQNNSFYSVNWITIRIVTSHVVTCVYLHD